MREWLKNLFKRKPGIKAKYKGICWVQGMNCPRARRVKPGERITGVAINGNIRWLHVECAEHMNGLGAMSPFMAQVRKEQRKTTGRDRRGKY